jgi:peptide deformylase
MILPIVAYGDPVLRKKGAALDKGYEGLETLIGSMFETMYNSRGVGLAAPQVGKSLNLFIIDTEPMEEDKSKAIKRVFINSEIIEESGDEWEYEEGCLSIPNIRENVSRQPMVKIRYQDEHFKSHTDTFEGMSARVIQHEYDHVEGILFVDHISEFKKRLLKKKLLNISKGIVDVDYRMRFPSGR